MSFRHSLLITALIALPWLAGCDQLGIETPAQTQARQDLEGKAIGSACRQTGRPLEDCYARAQKDKKTKLISRASIFNGWKEMDAYMRENNLAIIAPAPDEPPAPAPVAAEGENADAKPEEDKADAKDAKSTKDAKETEKAPAGKNEKAEPPAKTAPATGKKISAATRYPTFA
ncbi:MAG: hypothetical protein ACM31P_15275 [Actinomycetota bacterium]